MEPAVEQKAEGESAAGPALLVVPELTGSAEEEQRAQLSIQSAATKKSVRFLDPNDELSPSDNDGDDKLDEFDGTLSSGAEQKKDRRKGFTEILMEMGIKLKRRVKRGWKIS